MAFLNKSMLAKMAVEATVTRHPMLEKLEVPFNVKEAYLQGCVLAAVLKDESLSDSKKAEVSRLGASLQLSESEIGECIAIVTGLSTDDAKEQFVSEIFALLAGDIYPKFFLKDFEDLLKEGGSLPDEMAEYLDYFGSTLCNNKDWRSAIGGRDSVAIEGPTENPVAKKHYYCPVCGYEYEGDGAPKACPTCGVPGSKFTLDKPEPAVSETAQSDVKGHWVLQDKCVQCGCCIGACPANAIEVLDDGHYIVNREKCVDCSACEAECPNGAIVKVSDIAGSFEWLNYKVNHIENDPVYKKVVKIVVNQLGVDYEMVTPDSSYIDDFAADELDSVELIIAFEETFGVTIQEWDAERMTTPRKTVAYLKSHGV